MFYMNSLKLDLVIDYESNEEYQDTVLSIFGLEDYDDEVISKKTTQLYEELHLIPKFKDKLEYGAALVPTEDLEIGLVMLFSYYELPKFYKALQNHVNKE